MENQIGLNGGRKTPKIALWVSLAVVALIVITAALYFGGIFDTDSNSNTNAAVNANSATNTNVAVNSNSATNTNVATNANSAVNQNTNTTATSDGNSYEGDGFSFQPPAGLYVNTSDSGIQFATIPENPSGSYENTFLIIRIDNQEPAKVGGKYVILDRQPSSTTVIDNRDAFVFTFEHGYEGTPAFLVYLVKVDDTFYRFDFWNTSEETPEITEVLQLIKFAN